MKLTDKLSTVASIAEKTMLDHVIFVNGCFDLLHAGHIYLLNQAKDMHPSSKLVVGINKDFSVSENKGKDRPIIPERQRAYCVASLGCVDYVFLFNDKTVEKQIEALSPSVWVKGPDYKVGNTREEEYAALKNCGGKLEVIEYSEDGLDSRTTNIINRIKKLGED